MTDPTAAVEETALAVLHAVPDRADDLAEAIDASAAQVRAETGRVKSVPRRSIERLNRSMSEADEHHPATEHVQAFITGLHDLAVDGRTAARITPVTAPERGARA